MFEQNDSPLHAPYLHWTPSSGITSRNTVPNHVPSELGHSGHELWRRPDAHVGLVGAALVRSVPLGFRSAISRPAVRLSEEKMISGAVLSTKRNIALENTNKIRGEWLHLASHRVGSVSFFGFQVDIRNRFRLENAPVWTAFVDVWTDLADVWTAKVTFRNLDATGQAARRII
jgi:hypothetical protein